MISTSVQSDLRLMPLRHDSIPVRKHPALRFSIVTSTPNPAPADKRRRATIRLQPIVQKPLQPYVFRESACEYLECRISRRRCIAAGGREVDLGYQIAYCLGPRHSSCAMFERDANASGPGKMKLAIYAAVVAVMLGLVAAAVIQATGSSAPIEIGRAVGIG